MMDLSIVIVSFETRDLLRECLTSVANHAPARPFEVIVVDNGSADGSPEMVREEFPSVQLVANPKNLGFGRANNLGARVATGTILLLQNSDCLATAGLYDDALAYLDRQPRIGILGPLLTGREGELRQMSWGWTLSIFGEWRQKRYNPAVVQTDPRVRARVARLQRRTRDVGLVAGACMFARRETFEQLGGFDEDFVFYLEEPDLCLRARRAGWRVVFHPALRAIHLLGASAGAGLTRAAQIYRQSQVAYYRKHHGWLQRHLLDLYLRCKFARLRERSTGEGERRYYEEILEIIGGERRVDFRSSRPVGRPGARGEKSGEKSEE